MFYVTCELWRKAKKCKNGYAFEDNYFCTGLYDTRGQLVWLMKPCAFVNKLEQITVLKRALKKFGCSRNFSVSAKYK